MYPPVTPKVVSATALPLVTRAVRVTVTLVSDAVLVPVSLEVVGEGRTVVTNISYSVTVLIAYEQISTIAILYYKFIAMRMY